MPEHLSPNLYKDLFQRIENNQNIKYACYRLANTMLYTHDLLWKINDNRMAPNLSFDNDWNDHVIHHRLEVLQQSFVFFLETLNDKNITVAKRSQVLETLLLAMAVVCINGRLILDPRGHLSTQEQIRQQVSESLWRLHGSNQSFYIDQYAYTFAIEIEHYRTQQQCRLLTNFLQWLPNYLAKNKTLAQQQKNHIFTVSQKMLYPDSHWNCFNILMFFNTQLNEENLNDSRITRPVSFIINSPPREKRFLHAQKQHELFLIEQVANTLSTLDYKFTEHYLTCKQHGYLLSDIIHSFIQQEPLLQTNDYTQSNFIFLRATHVFISQMQSERLVKQKIQRQLTLKVIAGWFFNFCNLQTRPSDTDRTVLIEQFLDKLHRENFCNDDDRDLIFNYLTKFSLSQNNHSMFTHTMRESLTRVPTTMPQP